jgi:hypothetical protein
MALEEDDMRAPAHFVYEIGFKIAHPTMDRMWLNNDWIIAQGGKHGEEPFVAIADSSLIVVLIESVLVLNVDGPRIELADKIHYRTPPVFASHVDDRINTLPFSIGMGNDKHFAVWHCALKKFARLLAKRRYPTKPGRIGADEYDRLSRHIHHLH